MLDRFENFGEGLEEAPDSESSGRASSVYFATDVEDEEKGERAANPRRHKGAFRLCCRGRASFTSIQKLCLSTAKPAPSRSGDEAAELEKCGEGREDILNP